MISVLYVDDEAALLDLGKIFLERTGDFSVTTIDSASAAMALLETEPFDAIISDYQMPDVDGLEFLKQVRLHQGQIPFILFTGRGREEVVILALNNGADYYLQKGGNPQAQFAELSHKIRTAVGHRTTEKAFSESEEKFRVLADTTPVAITVYQGTRDVYVNDYTALMTGYSKEELYAMNFWDMIHPDSRELIRERGLARLQGEKAPTKHEIKYVTKNQEVRWAYLSTGSITYEGKPAGVATLIDITDRKNAEKESLASYEELAAAEEELRAQFTALKENQQYIQQSEQDYRSILENIQDVYYRSDTEGNLILASPSLATLLGYASVSELYGKNIAQTLYYDPGERKKVLADIQKNGSITNYEVTFKKQDGAAVIASTSSHEYFDNEGNYLGIEGIFRDITDRKQAEDALRRSEDLYRTIFEMTGAATIIIEEDTTIALANSGFAKISGYSIEELEGRKRWTEFVVSEDLERMRQSHYERRSDSPAAPRVYEFKFIDRSGEIRHCIVHVGMIPGTTRSVASVVDITKRVEMEQSLKESENLYRTIFNNTGAATIIIAPDTTILLANDGWVNLTGVPREDQENRKSWTTFIDKDDVERMKQYHFARRNDPTHVPKVYTCKLIDAGKMVHHCFVYVDIIPGSKNSVASLVDITDRVQAEELYHTVFENTGTAMAILEEDTTISHVNEEMESIWGYSREEIEGQMKWPQLIAEGDRSKMLEFHRLRRTDPDAAPKNYEFRLIHKNGESRSAFIAASMIPGTKKSVISIQDITEFKNTEKALRESEAIYQLLEAQLPDFVIIHEGETIVFVNAEGAHLMGKTQEQIIGTSVLSYAAPAYHELIKKNTRLRYQGVAVEPYEIEIIAPSGEHRWVVVRSTRIPNRESPATLTVLTDITERKRAEEALLESEEKYRTIIENMQDLVYRTDLQGNVTMASPRGAMLAAWGSPNLLIGQNVAREIYADPKEREQFLAVLAEKGEVNDYPLTLIAGDGTVRYATASSHFYHNAEGTVLGVEGILHDVTERKLAEKAMRESEERYRTLAENAPVGILTCNKEGDITFVNAKMLEMLGSPAADKTMEINLLEFPPLKKTGFTGVLKRCLETGMPGNIIESEYQSKWGKAICYRGHISPFTSGSTEGGALIIFDDVTERKLAEKALLQANQKLHLLSDITRHDINNQLTVLSGYLALLEEKIPDPALNPYFLRTRTAAEKISSMIQFTKEYDEIGVNTPVWQDCRTLIQNTVKEVHPGKIQLKNDLPAGMEVFADPLIAKVIYNLMDNAVRYGGKITMIRFMVEDRNGDRIMVCEDDGGGVATSDKERIFERGFGKNTGLGLALSREILSITCITIIESGEPGRGARFEMKIPKGMWRMGDTDRKAN